MNEDIFYANVTLIILPKICSSFGCLFIPTSNKYEIAD